MIPDNLYAYLQNCNTQNAANGMEHFCNCIDKKEVTDSINLDKLDDFFITVGNIFAHIIENGLLHINYENILFESKHTTLFFTTGLKCIKNAVLNNNITIILEFLLLSECKDNVISYNELFEMALLKRIIPLIARQGKKSVQEYLEIVGQFGSYSVRNSQSEKFDIYLQSQKYLYDDISIKKNDASSPTVLKRDQPDNDCNPTP